MVSEPHRTRVPYARSEFLLCRKETLSSLASELICFLQIAYVHPLCFLSVTESKGELRENQRRKQVSEVTFPSFPSLSSL